MNLLRNMGKSIREEALYYWSVYRTDQLLRSYTNKRYDKVLHQLKKFKNYSYINIDNYPLIYFLISEKNMEMIENLMKLPYKNQILTYTGKVTLTPINFALINNEFEILEKMRENGANLFMPGVDGNTALHTAAFYGNLEALKYCLQHGCDINAQNDNKETALHIAIMNERIDCIKHLLENGANAILENKYNYFPIHEAVDTGNLEIVKLLYNTLENVRKVQREFDPVHLSARLEKEDILDYLIKDRKSYVNIMDNSKRKATPLHYAVNGKSSKCLKYLLRAGALVNAADEFGNTPMHLAVLNKDLDMIATLQEYGANALLKNKDDLSAIDLCFTELDKSVMNLFRSYPEYNKIFTFRD